MKKGSQKIILIFIAVIFLILLLLKFSLNSSYAAHLISKKISANFKGSLFWDQQKISFHNGKLSIRNFLIYDENLDSVIIVNHASAVISLKSLLKGNIFIKDIYLTNAEVSLRIGEDSSMNVVSAFLPKKRTAEKKSKRQPVIDLEKINIKNCNLLFVNDINSMKFSADSICCSGSYNITSTIADVILKTKNVSFVYKDSVEIDSLNFEGEINRNKLPKFAIELFESDDRIKLNGQIDNVNDITNSSAQIKIGGNLKLSNYSQFIKNKEIEKGEVELTILQKETFNNPDINSRCKYFVTDRNDKSIIKELELEFLLKNKSVDIRPLIVTLNDNTKIESSGNIDFSKVFPNGFMNKNQSFNYTKYNIKAKLNSKTPAKRKDIDKTIKNVVGAIKINGSGILKDSVNANGHIELMSDFFPAKNIKDKIKLKSVFNIQKKNLDLNAVVKSNYTGEGYINGKFDSGSDSLDFRVENLMFDTEILNKYTGVDFFGILTINGELIGSLKRLRTDIYISGDNIAIDSVFVNQMKCVLSVNNENGKAYGHLQLNSNAGYGELIFDSKCFKDESFEIIKNPEIKAKLTANINNINPILGNGLKGDIKINSEFEGPLESGMGSALLLSEIIDVNYLKIKDAQLKLSYFNKKILIDTLLGTLPNGYITGKGDISDFKSFNANVDGEIQIDSINVVHDYNNGGLFNFNVKGNGFFDNPVVKLKSNVDNPVLLGQDLDSLVIAANMIGGIVDFNIYSDFKSYGSFNLNDKRYSVHATLDSTDFMTFLLPKDQGKWKGLVSGYSYVKGTETRVDSLVLDLYNVNLDYDTLNVANSEAVSFFYSGDSLYMKDLLVNLMDNGTIKMKGDISSSGRGKLDGSFNLPYSALEYLTDDLREGKGYLNGGLNISGSLKQPLINGYFSSDSTSSFIITSTDQKFQVKNIIGNFNDTSITFSKSFFNIDDGEFEFEGVVSSPERKLDSSNINMSFNFNELPVIVPDDGEFSLSGNINVITNKGKGKTVGDVKINDGIYYKNLSLNIFDKDNRSRKKTEKNNKNKITENIKLDLQLLPYNPVNVDNNIAYLNVLPQVKLQGSFAKPIVAGRAKVVDGYISFRNREFKIKRGVLDFVDPYSNNPNVDIEAVVKIDKWEVTILVSGNTNDKLDFRLKADPFLSDREILSLLLIGKPEISGIEDAISVAGEFAGEYLGRTVGKVNTMFSLPVDKVSVSSNDISNGLKVSIEQDISKYLSTVYSINMKNGDVTRKAELLLKIFDNFSAKGFTETDAKKGIEVEAGFEKQ